MWANLLLFNLFICLFLVLYCMHNDNALCPGSTFVPLVLIDSNPSLIFPPRFPRCDVFAGVPEDTGEPGQVEE